MALNNSLALYASFVVAAIGFIMAYNNARLNPKSVLHRVALVHPRFSPWMRLLNNADEESFLEVTGFNFQGFRELVTVVATLDERQRIRRRGRPPLLDIHSQLGLYLFYVGSTMKAKHLSLIFGVLPNTVTTIINRIAKRIVKALRNHPAAKIQFPNVDDIQTFCEMVRKREPLIDDVFAFFLTD